MSASKGKILLVDDEPAIREILEEHFAGQGYQVGCARDGQEALAAVAGDRPDVVVLDVGLPGMNGLEVLRRLYRHDPTIAVIMISGNADVALAQATLKLGAIDYVFKPLDFDRLDRAIFPFAAPQDPLALADAASSR
jgi:DNA-binding NtrC family response regulator